MNLRLVDHLFQPGIFSELVLQVGVDRGDLADGSFGDQAKAFLEIRRHRLEMLEALGRHRGLAVGGGPQSLQLLVALGDHPLGLLLDFREHAESFASGVGEGRLRLGARLGEDSLSVTLGVGRYLFGFAEGVSR